MTSMQVLKQALNRPIQWLRPTPADLARWVKQCLDGGSFPILSAHAGKDRLKQRGFTHEDVIQIIRSGYPYRVDRGNAPDEWKVNLSLTMPNGRDAAVVCLVSPHHRSVIILTVMWVDKSYLKA